MKLVIDKLITTSTINEEMTVQTMGGRDTEGLQMKSKDDLHVGVERPMGQKGP